MKTLESNNTRDFIHEAQTTGSKAQTRKGAISAIISDRKKHWWRYQGALQTIPLAKSELEKAQFLRRQFPEAKRARDDRAFRKNFLARIRTEERRLVETIPDEPNAVFGRLEEIAEERSIATGRPVKAVPTRAWKTTEEVHAWIRDAALEAGLSDDWNGYSFCDDRGDHFHLAIMDSAAAPAYHATPGTWIGLVRQTRRRIYAKRSDFRKSDREDVFLIGRNENGNAFAHQVSNTISRLFSATAWIWGESVLIDRQGDIGIAVSALKHAEGTTDDIDVMGGHSRHRFIGEVYRNGSIHIRSGFLIHTGNQHPPIYLDGSCWRRIVIARRSSRDMSTAD